MKIAAITMCYKSYDTLRRWHRHYSQLIGAENLYVISHGNDPVHQEIATGSTVIALPREDSERFENRRNTLLGNLQVGLAQYFDVVIKVDTDELLFHDPELYHSFPEVFERNPADGYFALGFEVYQREGDAALTDASIASQRGTAMISFSECKGVGANDKARVVFHGLLPHDPRALHEGRLSVTMPKGLYLAHTKFADFLELARANRDRRGENVELDAENDALWGSQLNEYRRSDRPVLDDADVHLDAMWQRYSTGFGFHRPRRKNILVVKQMRVMRPFRIPERFRDSF